MIRITAPWHYWRLPPTDAPATRDAFLRALEIGQAGHHTRLDIGLLVRRGYFEHSDRNILEPVNAD